MRTPLCDTRILFWNGISLQTPAKSFVNGSASSFCMATKGPHIVWFQPRASGWNRPHLPADDADEDSDLL